MVFFAYKVIFSFYKKFRNNSFKFRIILETKLYENKKMNYNLYTILGACREGEEHRI